LATPGLPLVTVEDDIHYRLEAVVEESQIGKIRAGATVRYASMLWGRWNAGTGRGAGTGRRPVQPELDREGGPPAERRSGPGRQILRSGLFGKALFSIGQRQALTIPEKAVMVRGQLQEIYVLDAENIARLRLIKTGTTRPAGGNFGRAP